MSIRQISVFLENKPGALLALTKRLAEERIDMKAFSLAETSDFGIARFIADDPYAAANVLKEADYVYRLSPVIGVAIPNTPGGLNQVLEVLSEEKVNVEYMYAFHSGEEKADACMIFKVEDPDKAELALTRKGSRLAEQISSI